MIAGFAIIQQDLAALLACDQGELKLHNIKYSDLLGKPYRLGARGPEYYDCWGICIELGKRAGIDYPADFTPQDTPEQSEAITARRDNDFEKLEKPEPYCIVTFKITPPFIDHCGIVLSDCKHFVHIMKSNSVSVNRIDHKILAKRIDGFYRLKK